MRSTLDRGRNDQPPERTPGSLSRTLPVSQEDFNRHVCCYCILTIDLCCKQYSNSVHTVCHIYSHVSSIKEKQKVDTEQCKLKKAEITTKAQEDEQNQVLQLLQSSTEISLKSHKGSIKSSQDTLQAVVVPRSLHFIFIYLH